MGKFFRNLKISSKRVLSFTSLLLYASAFLATINAAAQQTYYIANNGNDANSGLTASSPIRTISKVNTLTLGPGSKLLFRRGDIFEGGVVVKQSGSNSSPIIIDAYGSGDVPTISGSTQITNWQNDNNGAVWRANCSSCESTVTGLSINAQLKTLGRFPNSDEANGGYLTVKEHVGNSRLVSLQNLNSNWTGGEVVVRSNYFIIDRATITQQVSNTLALNNTSAYNLSDNFGFFIQNHLNTLDRQDEWYYNASTKTVYVYNALGNPNSQQIRVTTNRIGIDIRGQSYVTVQNIQIKEQLNYGIYCENVNNVIVRNCVVSNQGENGVWFNGSGNTILFDGNTIADVNNNGFQADVYNNFTFQNNNLKRVALAPGRGKSGDAQYLGAIFYSIQSTIQNNVIDSIGYSALVSPRNSVTIQKNVISNFCMTKSDGGGIYMVNNAKESFANITVQDNIVSKGMGVPEGTPDGFRGSIGIYLDNCIANVNLLRNSVFQCRHYGIYLHGTQNVLVDSNVCYDNDNSQFTVDYTTDCVTSGNTVQNNIFVSGRNDQYTGIYDSYTANLSTFGNFSNNVYSRPLDDVQTLRLSYPPPNGRLFDPQTLLQWQTQYNKDAGSRTSPITYKDYYVNAVIGGERVVGGDFSTGTGYGIGGPFVFSTYNNGQGTWDTNNRINGGSLNLNFTSITNNPGASLYAAQVVSNVSATKKYLVSFDAVSTVENRVVQVYMQTQFAPFREITLRPGALVGTSVKHYEFVFQPIYDEQNALLVVRVFENNQPLFIDNLSFKECDATRFPTEAFIQYYYNPTPKDSVVTLVSSYRDAYNQIYNGSFTLPAFRSKLLYRDSNTPLANTDLSIDLTADKLSPAVNDVINFRVNIKNEKSLYPNNVAAKAFWKIIPPRNMQIVSYSGLQFSNNILTGRVQNLPPGVDTTFNFLARVTAVGSYDIAVQVGSSAYYDPDSTPSSGTGDGEDDQDHITLHTKGSDGSLYVSSNINQTPLLQPVTNEPSLTSGQADLSLKVYTDKAVISSGDIVTVNVLVSNRGASTTTNVQIQDVLPSGLQFVSGAGWVSSGNTITRTINSIPANTSFLVSFTTKSVNKGYYINKTQIIGSSLPDPDSIPNNGFMVGEDDDSFNSVVVK